VLIAAGRTTVIIQLIQSVLQKRLTPPVLRGERLPTIAAPLRVLFRLLRLRDLPAYLIAFGVWSVHVKDK
jgi:hypothetical protein